jgi:hypothetical protein
VMVSPSVSANTDNKPAVGEKVALIAMVRILSGVDWAQRALALSC